MSYSIVFILFVNQLIIIDIFSFILKKEFNKISMQTLLKLKKTGNNPNKSSVDLNAMKEKMRFQMLISDSDDDFKVYVFSLCFDIVL